MKKSLALTIAVALTTVSLYASEDASRTYYFGFGYGNSDYQAAFRDDDDYIDENDGHITKRYDANDKGYKIYGGYQFNEIIAVEASFTDYGTFVASKRYTQKPKSVALYANAGYNFFNRQLRPFALLGVGYLKTNQSRDVLEDDLVTANIGVGIEYSPTVLKGVGFRVVYERDFRITSQEAVDESGDNYSTGHFAHTYKLPYIGVQYKF